MPVKYFCSINVVGKIVVEGEEEEAHGWSNCRLTQRPKNFGSDLYTALEKFPRKICTLFDLQARVILYSAHNLYSHKYCRAMNKAI